MPFYTELYISSCSSQNTCENRHESTKHTPLASSPSFIL